MTSAALTKTRAAKLSLSFIRKQLRWKQKVGSRKKSVKMSAGDDTVEPMEIDDCKHVNETQRPNKPAEAQMTPSQKEDDAQVMVHVKWLEDNQPQKPKVELEKILQTWANKNKTCVGCKVESASEDGIAVIKITPASALNKLQKLVGQTLNSKDGKQVTVKSISLTQPEQKTQKPDNSSVNAPSYFVSEPQHDHEKQRKQSSFRSSATGSTAEEDMYTFPLPISHFWYVSHIYKEEIKRIEKENGVEIAAELMVTLKPNQKDGDPKRACSEFTSLVQKSLTESNGSVFQLKYVNLEEWRDTLKIIQKNENKLLLTLSPEEITICGPTQSQDAIRKSINTRQQILTNTSTFVEESQDTSLTIGMKIKDPLVDEGLTMEESYWRLMITSFSEKIAKIKTKFDVDFKTSSKGQGKVDITICDRRSEGNASMKSHAARALLRLYQAITTSPLSFTLDRGASGFAGSLKYDCQSEGASGGPVSNGHTENGMNNTEAPSGGAATAADNEDEKCPICIDTFTNKKQLKCKHAFCEECLEGAKKSIGPICPVCKDVFGMMKGDQPEGRMSWIITNSSLPGFPHYATIEITYEIFSGTQTKKHPQPGHPYAGVCRRAYLPNNHEGNEVLKLLKKAFDQRLIFTIGTSRTTGMDNQVTWNDIHHKTSTIGGPQCFGYPDPGYLSRVREELRAKGIK